MLDIYDNRITITTASESEAERILEVLDAAEQNGEIDFAFDTAVTTYPR